MLEVEVSGFRGVPGQSESSKVIDKVSNAEGVLRGLMPMAGNERGLKKHKCMGAEKKNVPPPTTTTDPGTTTTIGGPKTTTSFMVPDTTSTTSAPKLTMISTTTSATTEPETTTMSTTTEPETTTSTTTTPTTTSTTTTDPITTFCVVADAPYRYKEHLELIKQVDNMDSECEFVAHLGDIRSARLFDACVRETYTNASSIMKRSKKPVLMMLGGKTVFNVCRASV